jgi:hypothetical protein
MRILRLFPVIVVAAEIAAAGPVAGDGSSAGANARTPSAAPVIRSSEPSDTVIVTLPGPLVAPVPVWAVAPPGATPSASAPDALPLPRRTERNYPEEFQRDSAKYLQQRIGHWKASDAQDLLGRATRERPALGDNDKPNGVIQAFPDPTGRFKEFELDFEEATGVLRTVFVYPWNMTWQTCREIYGAKVSEASAAKGRRFFSYLDRRLDVLVDASGKVISLGLY